jgi:UDP-N-acetylglucosamine pyrophosphorylase
VLEVSPGIAFLDLIVRQIAALRQASGSKVRLLLMNSFSTSGDTLDYLKRHADGGFAEASEVELMQNQVPKIDEATLAPAEWPANPSLEWCPPGHGDLYPALVGSGWLDRLLADGVKYAFVSNSDNLGAVLEPGLLKYFAESGAPFLMEVTRRTPADRKGGHLAVRRDNQRLLLREVAQCPESDLDAFQDIGKHRYFNTNSIWLRLDLLKDRLEQGGGVLPLPMIRNRKTIDPRDKNSTPVIQLEVAMGAAIECFEGARAIEVSRARFAPVKSTADLFALRSDAYSVSDEGRVELVEARKGVPPVVKLDDSYKLVDSLEALGVPSLAACEEVSVQGPVSFSAGVVLKGRVAFSAPPGGVKSVVPGTYADGEFPL